MRRLIPAEAGTRTALARLVAVAIGQIAASIVLVFSVHAILGGDGGGTRPAVIALGMAAGATVLLRYFERVIGEDYGQRIVHAIRTRLADHLVLQPVRSGLPGRGEMLLRFVGDLSAIRTWHVRGVATLVVAVPVLAGGMSGLLILDWHVGFAGLVLLTTALVAQVMAAPGLRAASLETRRRRTRLAAAVTDSSEGLATLQVFGRIGVRARSISRKSAALAEAMRRRAHWSGLMRMGAEFGAAGMPVAILMVWFMVPETELGVVSAALALSGLLVPRLRDVARAREYRELARVSEERIEAFLARPALDRRPTARGIARRSGKLALRDVQLDGVIESFSAEAAAGARVAVSGPNGSGKSRLLGLIAGLEEPDRGRIVLDGRNVGARKRAALHRLVALTGDETPLLRGSVAENIRCGARATGGDAERILELCGWEELLARLPAGGETRIGSGGRGLSAGQRARIGLIRALMRQPVVLLLDEVDSVLDEEGKAALARVFEGFEGTILMATHDPRWLARCDAVWTLGADQARTCGIEGGLARA